MKLCVPENILGQHLVVLGKTGAGKSSALRHIVEHLLDRNKRVCIVDPKGDWWGIKTSADGRGPGYPVVAFGDFKNDRAGDVPINDRSGTHVAELISSGNRPCVIGLRGWTQGGMTRFWIDFAQTLFGANSGELYLVGDEFHNFAPKQWKGMSDKETPVGVGLHWANRLLSEGRGIGLICLLASQRPQKVHNDTLTSCETLVAMRVVHKADRDAVKAWIDGNGDPEVGKEVIDSLASMPRGDAWVWSPEVGFGPKRVTFTMFETFDSFAPPQLQKKVSAKGWADVDLEEVTAKLHSVIEQEKANDPKELKKQIAELKRELAKKLTVVSEPKETVKTVTKEKPVIKDSQLEKARKIVEGIDTATANFQGKIDALREIRDTFHAGVVLVTQYKDQPEDSRGTYQGLNRRDYPVLRSPRPDQARPPLSKADLERAKARPNAEKILDGALPEGERKVLTAIAQYSDRGGATREQITILTGYKRSTRDAYIQRLIGKELVFIGNGNVFANANGIAALGDFEPLPTGSALRDYWINRLPEGERKVFGVLIAYYPDFVPRDVISEQTDYKRSTRDAYIQRLGTRRLIEISSGAVKASDDLF